MSLMRFALVLPIIAIVGCASGTEETGSGSQDIVESIRSMVQRPDGRFDVTCKDGHAEVVTADQLRADQVCGGAGPATSAALSFACDSSWNLRLSVISADGSETTRSFGMSSPSKCDATARALATTRRDIGRPTILGVCNTSWNLVRIGVMPDGRLIDLPALSMSSPSACDEAATATNAAIPAASGPSAMVDYGCDTSWNLRLTALANDGSVTQAAISQSSPSACASAAASLRATRTDVQRTLLVGACDTSWNVQRFSVTPAAGLRSLAAQSTSSPSACSQQMALINQ